MKKLLSFLAAVILVAVGALLLAPAFLSTSAARTKLASIVHDATGRDLTIDGPIRFTLLPSPHLSLAGVAFANAPGASTQDMLQLKSAELELRLLPLLRGGIEIARFVLENPVITLEIDKSGRPNWKFDRPTAPTPAPAASPPRPVPEFRVDDAQLVNATVHFIDHRTGATQSLERINLTLALPDPNGPLTAKGEASRNGENLTFALTAGQPRALLDNGASALALHLAGATVTLDFAGELTGLPLRHAAGAIDLATPSLRRLAAWAGVPLAIPGDGPGPLTIKAHVDQQPSKTAFTDAALTLDAMTAQGALTLDTAGPHPALSGTLSVDRLDLNPYLPPAPATRSIAAPRAAPTEWSDAPLALTGLTAADMDFSLAAEALRYREIDIGKSALVLKLIAGKLTADLRETTLYGGAGHGHLTLDAGATEPALTLEFDLTHLAIQPFLTATANLDRLSGTGSLSLAVTGHGHSQRAIINTLAGSGALKLVDGQINGLNLLAMAQNAAAGLTHLIGPGNITKFSTLSGTFTIAEGIVSDPDLSVTSDGILISGAGTIGLPQRTIDYRIVPQLRGIAVAIQITGTWDHMHYKPDVASTLRGIARDPKPDGGTLLRGLLGR